MAGDAHEREGQRVHALGRFLQERMDAEQWSQADLARRAGLSRQVVSKLLDGSRGSLVRPPSRDTIAGLAAAIGGANAEVRLWARVAESMGLPTATEVPISDAASLTNQELIAEITRRLSSPAQVPGTVTRLPRAPDVDDYDERAAATSVEPAGEPQPEEP